MRPYVDFSSEASLRFGSRATRESRLRFVRSSATRSHAALARRVAERGVVLVKDSLRSVAACRAAIARVLSITYARRTDLGAGVGFTAEMRRAYDSLRTEFVSSDDVAPDFQRVLSLADSSDVVLRRIVREHQFDDCDRRRAARVRRFRCRSCKREMRARFSCRSARRICCSRLRRCHRT